MPRQPNLTRRYAVALGTVALLAVGAHALNRARQAAHRGEAVTIDLAVRQRVLNQRLVRAALGATTAASGAERARWLGDLQATTAAAAAAHEALHGRAGASERLGLVDVAQHRLLSEARALAGGGEDAALPARAAAVADGESRVAAGLDTVVASMRAAALADLDAHDRAEMAILLGTLLVQALVGLVVVRPAVRRTARTLEERRRSERRFRAVFDRAGVGMLLLTPEGTVVEANPALAAMLGETGERLRGRALDDYVHPSERVASSEHWAAILDGRADAAAVERRFVRRDGDALWGRATTTLVRGDADSAPYVLSMIEDVTPRRLAEEERDLQARELALQSAELLHQNDELCRVRGELEEQTAALRAREEQLRLYVRHTPLAVAMCDRELRYLAASERWLAESAASDSLVTTGTHFVLGPHAPGRWRQVLERGLAGVAEQCDEEAVVRPDGTLGWMRWAVHPWYAADGSVGGLIAFYEGITRRKHAEMALRDSEERLRVALHGAEAASRAKSDFLARMSHELRTPLNSIIGFANVLRKNRQGTLRPAEVNYLERVYANGTHLLGIINDILDLSKVEAGKVEVTVAPVDLGALVRETLAELAGEPHPGVALCAEVPPGATVETDAAKLKQVVINLVGNALKFTERGSVTVCVETDAAGQARAILVRDTGIGIPQDRRQAIFEAFEQAEATTARRYGGTGLGLAITRSLCALLGARLSVESDVGVGSTFRVAFAARPALARPLPSGV